MNILWAPEAEDDRAAIWDYISAESPAAAARLDRIFSACVEGLRKHPLIGHPGLITGTREIIPHENYRLVYEVEGDTIWILAIVHTSRQWPPC